MYVDNGFRPCSSCEVQKADERINADCILARNGFKPYARCDHCTLKAGDCMGIQSTGLIFAISFLAAMFMFLHDPILIKGNIVLLIALLFLLGYRIMVNTDELASTSEKNRKLKEQVEVNNQSLETEVNRRTSQLQKMATQDTLTGLMNRHAFERTLGEIMRSAKEEFTEHVLCYLDLDQFKIVNDTCGHVAGDELLRQLSLVLRRSVRGNDVVARLGGDEFGIIYRHAGIDEAEMMAERLLQHIGEYRFFWEGKTFRVGASVGMVAIRKECCTLATILSRADSACYAAKDHGRNRIHIANDDDIVVLQRQEQMQWINRIERALEDDRLSLYVQPIADLVDPSSVQHYEVLLRMRSPEGDVVLPMAFIPAAERYGKMVDIDRWVIDKLFSSYYDVRQQVRTKIRFNVNLSGISLNDETMAVYIQECFERHHLPYDAITFEVTETAAISNIGSAQEFIERFRALGCKFALDDFGCGLSSFSYLQNLPVDYLKIDGSFVIDIDSNDVNRAMVDAINQIGHVMGIATVCEFVENDRIVKTLRDIGVDYAQGHYIGKPQPLETLGT
ncbi:MAG TPA: EAL domain-containing protein [Sulfuricurvum sp.]|nr:EAL domain-containing protein [Sulfuricurvum sp.]